MGFHLASALLPVLLVLKCSLYIDGFSVSRHPISTHQALNINPIAGTSPLFASVKDGDEPVSQNARVAIGPREMYPVISRIANTEWTGRCRYTGANLAPVNIKLVGGVRYDIVTPDEDDENQNHFVKLSSFLTFPNGNTRDVVMQGRKDGTTKPLKLTSAEGDGPIFMLLTELAPDTILINEIEESSGKTILTASLSIAERENGEMELIQVSHEVGDNSASPIEGHQTWRLYKNRAIEFDDFAAQDTTRR